MLPVASISTVRKFFFQRAGGFFFQWWSGCSFNRFQLVSWSSLQNWTYLKIQTLFFSLLHFFQAKNDYARLKGTTSGCGEKIVYAYFVYFFFLINVRNQLWQKKWVGRKLTFNFAKIQNPQIVAFERFFHQIWLEKKMTQTWVINLIFLSRQTSDNALLENKLQFVHHTHFGGMSHLQTYTVKYDIPHFCAHKE